MPALEPQEVVNLANEITEEYADVERYALAAACLLTGLVLIRGSRTLEQDWLTLQEMFTWIHALTADDSQHN